MKLTLNQRLEILIKSLGYNPNSFSVALGYASNTKIQRLINTNNKPSIDIIIDINNKFDNINIDWLITGNGDMKKTINIEDTAEYKALQAKYYDCLEKNIEAKNNISTIYKPQLKKSSK